MDQVDFSRQLIERVKTSGYALLDVNLYPKPSTSSAARVRDSYTSYFAMSYHYFSEPT